MSEEKVKKSKPRKLSKTDLCLGSYSLIAYPGAEGKRRYRAYRQALLNAAEFAEESTIRRPRDKAPVDTDKVAEVVT